MKHLLQILFLLFVIFCFDTSCYTTNTYRCVVRYRYNQHGKKHHEHWAGVILNSRYVLSVSYYNYYNPESLKVVIFNYAGKYLDVGKDDGPQDYLIKRSTSKYERDIYNAISFDSLLLIRLKSSVDFWNMHYIYLPDGEQIKTWANHFALPNNTKFTTSYWYRKPTSFEYTSKEIRKIRRCPNETCLRDNGLIPACFTMKSNSYVSLLRSGEALLYKDTLVGIRKFSQQVEPLDEFPEDYFINVAAYTKKILHFMDKPIDCSH